MKRALAVLVCILMCTAYVFALSQKVLVTKVVGKAFVKLSGKSDWTKCYAGMTFNENTAIRTEARSRVKLMLYDGSSIIIGQKSDVHVKDLANAQKTIIQNKGTSRFRINKLLSGRAFECKTPTAVCSIRGTEFSVTVGDNDLTTIKVFTGLVNVMQVSGIGEEVPVHPNEKIDVAVNTPPGAPVPFTADDNIEIMNSNREVLKQDAQGEINMDLSQEAVQQMAANEMKAAEYQKGKTIIDVFGNRVRIDEYIVRPDVNQYKLVAMNKRKDRFDWYQQIATFDKPLPTDLTQATKWIGWTSGATEPDYWLVANQCGASNTTDKVEWGNTGGHIVDSAQSVSGKYEHQYNNYYFTLNGLNKISYAPKSGITNVINPQNDIEFTVAGQSSELSSSQFSDWWAANVTPSTPSGSDKMHNRLTTTFGSNTYSEDYYTIDDLGKIPTSAAYAKDKYKYNMELVMQSDEFTGKDKKIDLCVEPEIFKMGGLIQ